MDFPFERYASGIVHSAPDFFAETFKVGGGRGAGVDQEIAMLLGYLGAAAGQSTTAGGVDQFPCLHVRWIAEG